jgi:hypothetical protein
MMLLYNVTVNIDQNIQEDWLNWMKTKHIPEVLATNCFVEARLSRIQGEEEGGVTFSIMYLCENETIYNEYQQNHAPILQQKHAQLFQGKFAAFRTILTVLEEFKTR